MKSSNLQWKARLGDSVPDHLAAELDVFEHEIALKKQGKIEDRVFAETRLRRGACGQRYDNGQRSDGTTTRTLHYPSANTKGPNTLFDAPGMQRIKIPFGGLNANQLEVLAEVAEEYSDGIAHIPTRQDLPIRRNLGASSRFLFRAAPTTLALSRISTILVQSRPFVTSTAR